MNLVRYNLYLKNALLNLSFDLYLYPNRIFWLDSNFMWNNKIHIRDEIKWYEVPTSLRAK